VPFNTSARALFTWGRQGKRDKGDKDMGKPICFNTDNRIIIVRAMDWGMDTPALAADVEFSEGSALEGILNVVNCASAWKSDICPLR
jgi:hypothetical protein